MKPSDQALLLRLGTHIAHYRAARGLTQAALAELVGVDSRSIQRMEAGRAAPSLARLMAVAQALAVPAARLLDPGRAPARTRSTAAHDAATGPDAALLRVWEEIPAARRPLALKILRALSQHRE